MRVQYVGDAPIYHHPGTHRITEIRTGEWITGLGLDDAKRLWAREIVQPDAETAERIMESMDMKHETIDKLWHGEDVFVMGSGPSLEGFDFSLLKGKRVIAINHSAVMYPEADAVVFMDKEFAKTRQDFLSTYKGMKFASMRTGLSGREFENLYMFMGNKVKPGKSYVNGLYGNRSSVIAINLAFILGAKDVYLLGYDLNEDHEKGYFFEGLLNIIKKNNKKYLDKAVCDERIKELEIFEKIQWHTRIHNCSKVSKIPYFDKVRVEDVI